MKPSPRAEQILRAAARLFAEKGYDGTSIRDVASAVDVHVATMYNHFKHKRALYEAACAQIFSERRIAHSACLDGPEQASVRLYRYVLSLSKDFMEDKLYAMLMHREMIEQDTRGLRDMSRRTFHEALTKASKICEKLTRSSDGYVRIFLVVSLVFGLVSTLRFGRYLNQDLKTLHTASNIARTSLARIIPEVDWSHAAGNGSAPVNGAAQ